MIKEGRPQNAHEAMLYDIMVKAGWHITKRGWPDFLCRKEGRLVAVEVKSKRTHKLKEEQKAVMLLLKSQGIECYRWTPAGFEPVTEVMDSIETEVSRRVLIPRRASKRRKLQRDQAFINESLDIKE